VEFETPDEAIKAVNELNGTDLGGRRIAVREDREDRDVKQFIEGEGGENGTRPPRRGRGRGRGRGRSERPPIEGEPSGFQVRPDCQRSLTAARQAQGSLLGTVSTPAAAAATTAAAVTGAPAKAAAVW
jgi:RNA recognition motif-containing protein